MIYCSLLVENSICNRARQLTQNYEKEREPNDKWPAMKTQFVNVLLG